MTSEDSLYSITHAEWSKSSELDTARRGRRNILTVFSTAIGVVVLGILLAVVDPANTAKSVGPLGLTGLIGVMAGIITAFFSGAALLGYMTRAQDQFEQDRQRRAYEYLLREVGSNQSDLDINQLLELNRSEMTLYHRLTLEQAKKSFRSSQVAMFVGLALLLGAGLVTLLPGIALESRVSVASLGVVSGAASTYIARTFLRSHGTTLEQLNTFFGQPLVSSHLLAAERVASQLPEPHRTDQLCKVVDRALAAADQQGGPNPSLSTHKPQRSKNRRGTTLESASSRAVL